VAGSAPIESPPDDAPSDRLSGADSGDADPGAAVGERKSDS
jgi:hypothetical protein